MALVISTPTTSLVLTLPSYQSPVLITPSGTVAGTTIGLRVLPESGWTIDNQGVIWGSQFGVSAGAGNATLVNTNLIASDSTGAYVSGGVIYNGLNATMVGSATGLLTGTISQITNNGIIAAVPTSGGGTGVILSSGVLLNGGDIVGGSTGVTTVGPSTVVTIGVIDAGAGPSTAGLLADNGGLLVNGTATAFILGGSGVVVGAGAETVSNAGGIVALGTAKSRLGPVPRVGRRRGECGGRHDRVPLRLRGGDRHHGVHRPRQ